MPISEFIRTNRFFLSLAIPLLAGSIAVFLVTRDISRQEAEKRQFRLESVHTDATEKINHSIDNFATLVSGIRAYIDGLGEIPETEELQSFVNDLLEDIDYKDSIIVSYLDASHTFRSTFTRTQVDPAGLVGQNVLDLRGPEQVAELDRIMQDHDLHLFEPINLLEGWAGIPLNFAVLTEEGPMGYVASIINFRTIIEPVYSNPDVVRDFAFRFSFVGGPAFDRHAVYDGGEVFHSEVDPEYFERFDIDESRILYSEMKKYGSVLRIGTAYKEDRNPALLTNLLILGAFLTIALLMTIIARQLRQAQRTNVRLEVAVDDANRASAAKDIFLSNMSHEIRTPLNAIIGFSKLLRTTDLSEFQSKYIQTIGMASENLLAVINDVLDISKIESGHVELEDKTFRIRDIVENVIELNSQAAKSKGLKLMLTMDDDLAEYVEGDPARLAQKLINLISNAVKFTNSGHVELAVREVHRQGDAVKVAFNVSDTGIGIEEDKLEKIFHRFTQAESSTTREYGGTGLGLSIVKALLDIQGGDLNVESKVGEGTSFKFELSYRLSDASKFEDVAGKIELSSASLQGIHVLIAEDNEHNQILAEKLLTKNNATVEIAGNGHVALHMLAHNYYDCVLMDLQMPKIDGFEATRRIRAELELSVPVIACTAHFMQSEKNRSLEAGMDDYLTKPYSEDDLVATILRATGSAVGPTGKKEREDPPEDLSDRQEIAAILQKMETDNGEEFVGMMLEIFNERIPKDLLEMEMGLRENNRELIRQKAHLISGTMASMGFKIGQTLAQDVELKAEDAELSDLIGPINGLNEFLQEALTITRSYSGVATGS